MLTQIASPHRWPSQCMICHRWPAQTICRACMDRFHRHVRRCTSCAAPVAPGMTRCGACLTQPPVLDHCLAVLDYEWPWTYCIGRLKFQQDVGLAKSLAAIMRSNADIARAVGRAHWVIAVPSTQRRLSDRGYNPAHLLARELGGKRCRSDLLTRTGEPVPQRGLSRAERLKNPRGTFQPMPPATKALRRRRIVLVDDVMTTGATLNEVARTLKNAGAAEVSGIVLARD